MAQASRGAIDAKYYANDHSEGEVSMLIKVSNFMTNFKGIYDQLVRFEISSRLVTIIVTLYVCRLFFVNMAGLKQDTTLL